MFSATASVAHNWLQRPFASKAGGPVEGVVPVRTLAPRWTLAVSTTGTVSQTGGID
jgi:hypothetical protein